MARSDALAKADTFELVDATAAHFQALGCAFMVVEATNQWTGAECKVFGRVCVHFAPYQAQPPNPSKDSGSMSYVIRLI